MTNYDNQRYSPLRDPETGIVKNFVYFILNKFVILQHHRPNSVCVNIFSGDPYKIVLQPK